MIQNDLQPIQSEISNRDLHDQLVIFTLAAGKERVECLPIVEEIMKKIEQDPVGKKAFIEGLNKAKTVVPPVEELAK